MKRMSEGQRNAQRRRAGQVRAARSPLPRMLFKTEPGPHTSDCAFWCAEPCNCMFRFDAKDLYDRYMDRQLEGK